MNIPPSPLTLWLGFVALIFCTFFAVSIWCRICNHIETRRLRKMRENAELRFGECPWAEKRRSKAQEQIQALKEARKEYDA